MKTKHDDIFRIDCIRMKRDIQRQIAAETKGMTSLERLAYYKRLARESPFKPKTGRRKRAGAGKSDS